MRAERRDDALQSRQPHQNDQSAHPRKRVPVEVVAVLTAGVPRDHGEGAGAAAVGHGDSRVGRSRDRARDSRDNLVRNAGSHQGPALFAASTEHERVAALESHHASPAAGFRDEQRLDAALGPARVARSLAHVDAPGLRGSGFQQLPGGQSIVDHHVRPLETPESLDRDQLRIARARTDQRDHARLFGSWLHRVHPPRAAALGSCRSACCCHIPVEPYRSPLSFNVVTTVRYVPLRATPIAAWT